MNKEYNCISHFGILGMKWGVRRYQNPDGSLTPLGKKRQRLGEWGKEAFKLTKHNYRHPFITAKANRASIKADPFLKRVKRRTIIQNTEELIRH